MIKLSWGVGIAISYGAFVLFLLGFWLFASMQDVNLVSTDYYEREIRYQQRIDKIKRTKAIRDKIQIQVKDRELTLLLSGHEGAEGTLTLYRPNDASMDRSFSLNIGSDHLQRISLQDVAGGMWRVFVEWESAGVTYFHEEIIFID